MITEINDSFIVSLNGWSWVSKTIVNRSLRADQVNDSNRDPLGELLNGRRQLETVGTSLQSEFVQWIKDFNADKKVSPITCFIEHQDVDNFTV